MPVQYFQHDDKRALQAAATLADACLADFMTTGRSHLDGSPPSSPPLDLDQITADDLACMAEAVAQQLPPGVCGAPTPDPQGTQGLCVHDVVAQRYFQKVSLEHELTPGFDGVTLAQAITPTTLLLPSAQTLRDFMADPTHEVQHGTGMPPTPLRQSHVTAATPATTEAAAYATELVHELTEQYAQQAPMGGPPLPPLDAGELVKLHSAIQLSPTPSLTTPQLDALMSGFAPTVGHLMTTYGVDLDDVNHVAVNKVHHANAVVRELAEQIPALKRENPLENGLLQLFADVVQQDIPLTATKLKGLVEKDTTFAHLVSDTQLQQVTQAATAQQQAHSPTFLQDSIPDVTRAVVNDKLVPHPAVIGPNHLHQQQRQAQRAFPKQVVKALDKADLELRAEGHQGLFSQDKALRTEQMAQAAEVMMKQLNPGEKRNTLQIPTQEITDAVGKLKDSLTHPGADRAANPDELVTWQVWRPTLMRYAAGMAGAHEATTEAERHKATDKARDLVNDTFHSRFKGHLSQPIVPADKLPDGPPSIATQVLQNVVAGPQYHTSDSTGAGHKSSLYNHNSNRNYTGSLKAGAVMFLQEAALQLDAADKQLRREGEPGLFTAAVPGRPETESARVEQITQTALAMLEKSHNQLLEPDVLVSGKVREHVDRGVGALMKASPAVTATLQQDPQACTSQQAWQKRLRLYSFEVGCTPDQCEHLLLNLGQRKSAEYPEEVRANRHAVGQDKIGHDLPKMHEMRNPKLTPPKKAQAFGDGAAPFLDPLHPERAKEQAELYEVDKFFTDKMRAAKRKHQAINDDHILDGSQGTTAIGGALGFGAAIVAGALFPPLGVLIGIATVFGMAKNELNGHNNPEARKVAQEHAQARRDYADYGPAGFFAMHPELKRAQRGAEFLLDKQGVPCPRARSQGPRAGERDPGTIERAEALRGEEFAAARGEPHRGRPDAVRGATRAAAGFHKAGGRPVGGPSKGHHHHGHPAPVATPPGGTSVPGRGGELHL